MLEDVPDEVPNFSIPITWVGIVNRQTYIQIRDPFLSNSTIISMLTNLAIGLSPLSNKRGIHMSRLENELQKAISKTYDALEEFTSTLALGSYNSQPCKTSHVTAVGTYILKVKTPKTMLNSQQILRYSSDVSFNGSKYQKKIGLTIPILIACPCGMRTIGQLGTHTQKGSITLSIKSSDTIDEKELLTILNNVSHGICELLKRPDESEIIIRALRKPQFVEDLAREVAAKTYCTFKNTLAEGSVVHIKVHSQESIHTHDVEAEINMSLKEIGENLEEN